MLLENKTSYTAMIVFLAITLLFWPSPFLIGFTDIAFLHKHKVQYILLFANEVFVAVTNSTGYKIFGMMKSHTAITVTFFVVFFGLTMPLLYTALLRSIVLENQSKYISANCSARVAVNGLAGYFIWSDKFINLPAYIISMVFYLLGVYLVSDFDMIDFKRNDISDVMEDEDKCNDDGNVSPEIPQTQHESSTSSHRSENFVEDIEKKSSKSFLYDLAGTS